MIIVAPSALTVACTCRVNLAYQCSVSSGSLATFQNETDVTIHAQPLAATFPPSAAKKHRRTRPTGTNHGRYALCSSLLLQAWQLAFPFGWQSMLSLQAPHPASPGSELTHFGLTPRAIGNYLIIVVAVLPQSEVLVRSSAFHWSFRLEASCRCSSCSLCLLVLPQLWPPRRKDMPPETVCKSAKRMRVVVMNLS